MRRRTTWGSGLRSAAFEIHYMNKAPYEQGSVGDVTNGSATIASLTQGFTWDALGQPATVTYPDCKRGKRNGKRGHSFFLPFFGVVTRAP